MMHFPLFQIPTISEKNSKLVENIHNYKFEISPLFSLFHYIFTPYIGKIIISPYFYKFAPDFVKFTCSFTYYLCFSFPPTLTMMHLCITQCAYWTPLLTNSKHLLHPLQFLR